MKKLALVLMVFFLLYYPPVLGVHSLRVLALLSFCYIGLYLRRVQLSYNINRVSSVYLFLLGVSIWLCVVVLAQDQSLGFLSAFFYWMISVIPASLMIGSLVKKKYGSDEAVVDVVLNAGMLQGILATAAFFSPAVKSFFLGRLSAAQVIDLEYYGYYVDMRLYGFSNGLTYAMPVLQAILAMVAVYLAVNKSVKYLGYVPLLLFSAVINGRTPFIIVAICGVILLLQKGRINPRKTLRVFLISVSVFTAFIVGVLILKRHAYYTFLWLADGVKQIGGFFVGDVDSGYFSYMLDPGKWVLPKGFQFVFGAGTRVMGSNSTGVVSDIGYVNDIWLGGVLYCIVMYSAYYCFIRKNIRSNYQDTETRRLMRYLMNCIVVCSVFLNFKGYIINLNSFSNYIILLAICLGYARRQVSTESL